MAPRFERVLSDDVWNNQRDELKGVIQSVPICYDRYAFDIHLRENNKMMVYHGTTCVLVVDLKDKKSNPFSAHPAYGEQRACSVAYQELKVQSWPSKNAITVMQDYLDKVVESVNGSKYRQEGLWMNKLAVRFGRFFQSSDRWLIIDREAVIGFSREEEKTKFYQSIKDDHQNLAKGLKEQDKKRWGRNPKNFGDELDFLALDSDKNLVCIELKHGAAAASGIYWGPLQASLYREAFERIARDEGIARGIKEMVQQKVGLGLLPKAALDRLPGSAGFSGAQGVLLIAEFQPNRKELCQKIVAVRQRMEEAGKRLDIFAVEQGHDDFIMKPL